MKRKNLFSFTSSLMMDVATVKWEDSSSAPLPIRITTREGFSLFLKFSLNNDMLHFEPYCLQKIYQLNVISISIKIFNNANPCMSLQQKKFAVFKIDDLKSPLTRSLAFPIVVLKSFNQQKIRFMYQIEIQSI